jgi:hypothetical protein
MNPQAVSTFKSLRFSRSVKLRAELVLHFDKPNLKLEVNLWRWEPGKGPVQERQ